LTVTDLTSELRKELGLDERVEGVLVAKAAPGPAQAAGVQQGDVIQMIDNVQVGSVKQFEQQLERLPKGKTIAVLVVRRAGPVFLALRVPEK
jgi:serine protease Do